MKKILRSSLFLLLLMVAFAHQAQAQNPKISIQGTLKTADGTTVSDGTYNVTFRLYNAINAAEGAHLWQEAAMVEVTGGIYSHYLGSVTPLVPANFATTLYLGVKVGTYELTPRTELSYSPYSFAVYSAVCSGAVGDIKHSILNPTQFATMNGACWVPMDGRALAATDQLRIITGMTSVPNGGGLFIRSQDFEGVAPGLASNQDPNRDHTSAIANLQTEAVQSHGHNVTDNGHSHPFDDSYYATGGVNHFVGGGGERFSSNTLTSSADNTSSNTTGISIPNTGNGPETRPRNMNFWVYIRIN